MKTIKRKVFVCVYCDGIYADEPVSQCDCMEADDHEGPHFIEGALTYEIVDPN